MAFQFPDPSVTPEFTGANGITYSWDATDGKWVVKGFSTEEDPRYVKRQGGDDMEGPLIMTGPRNAGDDPLLPDNVSSIKTLNVDNTQNSGLQLRHNGNAKVYVGDSDVSFAADIKFNRNAPTVIKNNTQNLLSFDGSEVAYLGEIIEEDDIVNKRYVENITDQLHQDIISLDEEIESIAKSMEKGFWHYEQASDTHRSPREGYFYLLKNYTPGTGGLGAAFTEEYSEAEAAVFNSKEWNPDSADGSGGANHTWADVEVGELIDLLDRPDPDFLFGKITSVDKDHHSQSVIIAFDKIEFDGSPTNNSPFQSLLKIFKEPTGGTASEFVKKTGDIMSGSLKIGDVSTMPDNVSTDSPKLYFANKNTSNAGKTPYLYSKSNTTTIYSSNALRSGAAISANGNLQYNGITRVGMDGNGGYLGKGTSESDRPLEWNESGIFKLWGYNGQGTSGQVLKLDSSLRPYWGTVSTSGNYVKTPSADANAGIEIYRSGSSYYIKGGAS